ncbi:MAG: hypothetical protein HYR70_12310 [Chloroflexi bacterium]|nr:hypothetical protein [Chloroflexota bacterium]MBI3339414.1 hypothetical protein [Chloroflexota bacterium]
MSNLWSRNTPEQFWLCDQTFPEHYWLNAIRKSVALLGLKCTVESPDELLALTLGEAQFGADHWELGFSKRLYYLLKPLLPRSFTRILRRHYGNPLDGKLSANWPVDSRYALFQQEVMRQLLIITGKPSMRYKKFWPEGHQFGFVLTHDIETAAGQAFVREVADIEEKLGFRSSFNFVLERYALDFELIEDLKKRGFEIGCHGLKHDGKLYNSKTEFAKRVAKINARIKEYGMVGFRSPLTHRNPEWMQILDIEYDSSFFDTDPFEPIPGGAMSIWPYFLGRFVELPYTLVQDYTLTAVLGETTPRLWLDKVQFLKKYHGMALLNTHPDYLKERTTLNIYTEFLQSMKNSGGYWHALPRDAARWWRKRAGISSNDVMPAIDFGMAALEGGEIII